MKKIIFPQSGNDVTKGASLCFEFLNVNVLFRKYLQPSADYPNGAVLVKNPSTGVLYTPKHPHEVGVLVVDAQ